MTTSSMNLTSSKIKEEHFPVAIIENLPDEIIQKIVADHLNVQDAASFGRTNKRMYSIVEDKDTWKALYARIIRVNIFKDSDHPIDWKNRVHLAYRKDDVFNEIWRPYHEEVGLVCVQHKMIICEAYINNRSFFERMISAFNWYINGISSDLSVKKEFISNEYNAIKAQLELEKKRTLDKIFSSVDFNMIDFSKPETKSFFSKN